MLSLCSHNDPTPLKVSLLAVLLAVGIHIQIALPVPSARIQIAASDLVVAAAALPVMYLAWQQRRLWAVASVRRLLLCFVAFSAALAFAAILRAIEPGLSSWALKKLVGWPALVGYALVIAVVANRYPRFLTQISFAFVCSAAAIALPGVILGFARLLKLTTANIYSSGQVSGLTEKPISFALLTIFAILLANTLSLRTLPYLLFKISVFAVLCSAVFFSDSRAGVAAEPSFS